MPSSQYFVVLIERTARQPDARPALDWLRTGTATLMALSLIAAALGFNAAAAQGVTARKHVKLAQDLHDATDDDALALRASRGERRKARWEREERGVRMVNAIVVSDSTDPELKALRNFIVRNGGSVQVRHSALRALTVTVPARLVKRLADRDDVASVSPNRDIVRTASSLEAVTGVLTSNVRTASTKTSYSGLDGSGIGIAVLDSGVMKSHYAFNGATGASRVRRSVNMLNANVADFTAGTDTSKSFMPGSSQGAAFAAAIANDSTVFADQYGHGTHVAAVAAGRAQFYGAGTPDTTGMAPGADNYDGPTMA